MKTTQFLSELLAAKENLFDMGTGSTEKFQSIETDLIEIAKLNTDLCCWPSDLELAKMNGLFRRVESCNKTERQVVKFQRPIIFDMVHPDLAAIQRNHNVRFDVIRTSRTLKFLHWGSIEILFHHIYESVDRGTDVIVYVDSGPSIDQFLKANDQDANLKRLIENGFSFKAPTRVYKILEGIGFVSRVSFEVDKTLGEHADGSKTVLNGRLMHFEKS